MVKIKIKKTSNSNKSVNKSVNKSINTKNAVNAPVNKSANTKNVVNTAVNKSTNNKSIKRTIKIKVKKQTEHPKKIEPLMWVLPNKKIFPKWINETFIDYKTTTKKQIIKKGEFIPFKYQLFLRDLMQQSSPYRGILLYHGLGSGKTCTTILITESNNDNVVVILPASLKDNFIKDGLQFCADYKRDNKSNNKRIYSKYYFVSSNASNTIQQLNKIGSLDNHIIVLDEEHNLISRIVGGLSGDNKQGREIYQKLMDARNCKIIALSGTPIINKPYELAILCNILRGYIYLTYFKILYIDDKYGKIWKMDLMNDIMKNIGLVDYVEVNQKNMTAEFHLLVKPWDIRYQKTLEEIVELAKKNGIEIIFERFDKYTLFPDGANGEGEREFDELFINMKGNKGNMIKNKDVFQRRILGLISYYKLQTENFPELEKIEMVNVEMSKYQFDQYMLIRQEEKASRKLSEIRIFSRQYSNFVFPVSIPRPGIGEKILKKNSESNEKIAKISQAVDEGEEDILKKEELNEYLKSIDIAMKKLTENAEIYLGKDLEIYSPKMKTILELSKKTKGLVFVYSTFRSLEGIEIFSKVLETIGYNPFTSSTSGNVKEGKHYMIYSGKEDPEERSKAIQVFNSEENKYGKYIKFILVTSAGAEGLDLKNIRQVHIMEPYWNETKIKQIIGRAVRRNSHIDLPESERKVIVYRYFAVIPESLKTSIKAKDRESTDEVIYELAKKKELITNEILDCCKSSAVDCLLNYDDSSIQCYDFADTTGLSYYPQLSKDLGMGLEEATRTITQQLRKGFIGDDDIVYYINNKKVYKATDEAMTKEIKQLPKIKIKTVIDLNKKELFDYDIAIKKQSKVKIGNYNNNAKYIK
jgi:superfamily II DNA or RNA helicase